MFSFCKVYFFYPSQVFGIERRRVIKPSTKRGGSLRQPECHPLNDITPTNFITETAFFPFVKFWSVILYNKHTS